MRAALDFLGAKSVSSRDQSVNHSDECINLGEKLAEHKKSQQPNERMYFKYKKEKFDKCNICQARKRLTYDHVPPTGCDNGEGVEVRSFGTIVDGTSERIRPTFIQNGLKYRTICASCNNSVGMKYDPALIALTRFVRTAIECSLVVPGRVMVRGRPGAIFRSILAHLVASRIDSDSLFDKVVRSSIINSDEPVPANFHLHYWIHPHMKTVVMRDFIKLGPMEPIFCQLLKFYPLGFLLTDGERFPSLPYFGNFNNVPAHELREFAIVLRANRHEDFPEAPNDETGATCYGSAGGSAPLARPRQRGVAR